MSKDRWRRALIVCLLVFTGLLGCQTLPPGMARVDSPGQRYVMKDFSVSAPAGDDWYVQMQGENAILFYRMADIQLAHSIVAGVKTFSPPFVIKDREELAKLLKDSIEKEQEKSQRYRNTAIDVRPDSRFGDYSVFVHSESKDFSPAKLPSGTAYLLLNTHAYYFKPPKSSDYLYVWYSERSRPEDRDMKMAEKADAFFQSFHLSGTKP
jgi:hypothetical protein